jgi:hypothetical protein
VFPLNEQPRHVQRLVDIAADRDVEGLRRDVEESLAGLEVNERPLVAARLIEALDRIIGSYANAG